MCNGHGKTGTGDTAVGIIAGTMLKVENNRRDFENMLHLAATAAAMYIRDGRVPSRSTLEELAVTLPCRTMPTDVAEVPQASNVIRVSLQLAATFLLATAIILGMWHGLA
jgi:hypothetical protein